MRKAHPEIPVAGLHHRHHTIHEAVEQGDLEDVESHFLSGADLNSTDDSGLTPLFYAVTGRNLEVVEFLLEHGALVNATDPQGTTPMGLAMMISGDDNPAYRASEDPIVQLLDQWHGAPTSGPHPCESE